MKYNVGDKVTIRKWEAMERQFVSNGKGGINLSAGCFYRDMKEFCGRQLTIVEKGSRFTHLENYPACVGIDYYKMKEDRGTRWWTDDMIEHNFTYGELILVNDCQLDIICTERVFIGYIDGAERPYCTTSSKIFNDIDFFGFGNYKYARKIENKVKITIDGKDLYISKESAEEIKKLGGA